MGGRDWQYQRSAGTHEALCLWVVGWAANHDVYLHLYQERGAAGTDWSRCESRHQRARMDEGLGTKRPYTSWEAQGACKLPDYAWSDWAKVQTVRAKQNAFCC